MKDNEKKDASAKSKPKGKGAKKKFTFREFVQLRHDYTRDEREELTRKLTGGVQQKAEQEEQLKAVSADFKAKIKTAQSVINEATNQLTNGYEMRNTEVTVSLDRKSGKKQLLVYRPSDKKAHGKLIRVDDMTAADYERLPMELPPASKKDKDKFTDEELAQVVEVIRKEDKASVALVQRRLRFGYTKAALLMDELERRGVVGPSKGSEPRDILNLPEEGEPVPAAPAPKPSSPPVSQEELQSAMKSNQVPEKPVVPPLVEG